MGQFQQILEHQDRIGPAIVKGPEACQRTGRVTLQHRFNKIEHLMAVGHAEHVAHSGLVDRRPGCERNCLVEQ